MPKPKQFYLGELVTTANDPRLFYVADRRWKHELRYRYWLLPVDSVADLASGKQDVPIEEIAYPKSTIEWSQPETPQWNKEATRITSADGMFQIFTSIGGRARGMYGVVGHKARVTLSYDGTKVGDVDTTKTGIPRAVAEMKRLANEFLFVGISRERANSYTQEKRAVLEALIRLSRYKDDLAYPTLHPHASQDVGVWERSLAARVLRLGRVIRPPAPVEAPAPKGES